MPCRKSVVDLLRKPLEGGVRGKPLLLVETTDGPKAQGGWRSGGLAIDQLKHALR